ncbi:cardiolipin synthase [Sphingobacterium corticis]|uniref:Cardiolipin synthase n=1 Tax=Sphingobacterium corticis TaxID=1812823 RepID=A0ABW5NHW9_9SPHI
MKEIVYQVWPFIQEWYWIPLFILYLGLISTILIENRNPTKTIAWVLVIVFLPFVGIALYYLFGQKFKKEKKLKKSSQIQLKKNAAAIQRLAPKINASLNQLREDIGDLSRVYAYLRNEQICIPSLSNDVQLMLNGEQKFEYMLKALENAEHSIHLEYYIFDLDQIGKKVISVLEQKAKEGVKVRLLIDAFGSSDVVKYLKKSATNIEYEVFLPVTFTQLANSNYRNHRKICVVDGRTAFVGGINISDRYINPYADGMYWRDTAVRIEGESVTLLQVHFWTLWNQAGGADFALDERVIQPPKSDVGHAAVSFAVSDPGSDAPYNMEALLIAIGSAKESIQLCTPYYIPSEELETALMMAAASGVRVELMVPASGDSWIVQHASFSFLKPLLQRGIHVYLYEKGFLHAKTVCIDGTLSFIGTVNLDIRSFYINYEIAAVIADREMGKQMNAQYEKDKAGGRLLSLADWAARPRWKKGVDSICRLLAPLL